MRLRGMETLRVGGVIGMSTSNKQLRCDYEYVTAPSSPGRCSAEFFFSVPSSPIRSAIPFCVEGQDQHKAVMQDDQGSISAASEFEFSARFSDLEGTSVSTADELFLNGQIRPVTKLSASIHQPQAQCSRPLKIDWEDDARGGNSTLKEKQRGRDRSWSESSRRRTRSLSPLRSFSHWLEESRKLEEDDSDEKINNEAGEACTKSVRSLKMRWSLKDFLYRSKSEGRGRAKDKLWGLSFSKPSAERAAPTNNNGVSAKKATSANVTPSCKPGVNGRARAPPSPHELHYTANRAQAEELKRRTFLPYRQGLLGCLGFPSKTYSVAIDGFPKPVNALGRR